MRSLALAAVALLLAACAATPRVPAPAGHPVDPQFVTAWSVAGRLAIAVASDGGSGTFDWTQRDATTELQVRGPLGAGALRIVTDGSTFTLSDGDGQRLDAEAARQRLRDRLGADLPLAEMRFWMLGLPAPGPDARVAARADGTRRIDQSGWQVDYEPFTAVDGWTVPTRLVASREGARIKVIADRWQLPPASNGPSGATP